MNKPLPEDPHKYIRLANPSPLWFQRWRERAMDAMTKLPKKWYIKERQ